MMTETRASPITVVLKQANNPVKRTEGHWNQTLGLLGKKILNLSISDRLFSSLMGSKTG